MGITERLLRQLRNKVKTPNFKTTDEKGKIYKKKSHQGVERKVCVLQKIF